MRFFNKFRKPCFWSIFPVLGAKNFFQENPVLSRTTSYWFLAPWQNFKKLMIKFQENTQTDRRTERNEGQIDPIL